MFKTTKITRSALFSFLLLPFALGACQITQSATQTETSESQPLQPQPKSDLLSQVKKRGRLNCGINGNVKGLSYVNEKGEYSGFDVDICRVVAAALLGNPDAVSYIQLDTNERFQALVSGKVDLLSRNTTYTVTRMTLVDFLSPVLYDGQGFMLPSSSGITSLEALDKKKICVSTGTTNELNLYDLNTRLNIAVTPIQFLDQEQAFKGYVNGKCDALTADRSQLSSRKLTMPHSDRHVILSEIISKEPLTPAVKSGEPKFRKAVSAAIFALIQAEEFGITKENLEQFKQETNPKILRFLGIEGSLGQKLGLEDNFVEQIISATGNYGEIYERNLGIDSELKLSRGYNQLWSNGGLLFSPPFR